MGEACTDAMVDAPFVDSLVSTQRPIARDYLDGTTTLPRNAREHWLRPSWVNELVPESLEIRVVEERGGGRSERAVGEDNAACDLVGQPASHQYS